jgi:malonate-semialdehyde dehydrogenase (acetylating)/methylmalonate-semialdehyde dehydrogenase
VTVGKAREVLLPQLREQTAKLTIGNGAAASIDVGPVISGPACRRILDHIASGLAEGAEFLVDGRQPSHTHPEGHFVGPTILNNVRPHMQVAREEIFGPVLCLMHADTLDEAIELVNRDSRGNGTSIFTENGAAISECTRRVEVGMIGVNIGVAASPGYFPFSGWKDSFFGDLHAQGWDAVEFFTRKKTVTSRFFSGRETGKFFVEECDKA